MSITESQKKRMAIICNSSNLALLAATRNSDGEKVAIVCFKSVRDEEVEFYPLAEIPDGDLGQLYTPRMEHTYRKAEVGPEGELKNTIQGEFTHVQKQEGEEG